MALSGWESHGSVSKPKVNVFSVTRTLISTYLSHGISERLIKVRQCVNEELVQSMAGHPARLMFASEKVRSKTEAEQAQLFLWLIREFGVVSVPDRGVEFDASEFAKEEGNADWIALCVSVEEERKAQEFARWEKCNKSFVDMIESEHSEEGREVLAQMAICSQEFIEQGGDPSELNLLRIMMECETTRDIVTDALRESQKDKLHKEMMSTERHDRDCLHREVLEHVHTQSTEQAGDIIGHMFAKQPDKEPKGWKEVCEYQAAVLRTTTR